MTNSSPAVLDPVIIQHTPPARVERSKPVATVNELPAPDWLDRGQIPGLDGLRALAVTLVVLVHSEQTAGFPDWLRLISNHGYIGVDLFFVISGFLITTLLAREMERHGQINLKRFYVRRSLRIIPAYCVFLVAVALCQAAGEFELRTRDWVGALTYTTNFLFHPSWELGHTWSLSVEEHFYLVWPSALFVGGMIGGWRAAIGCVMGCWLLRCIISLALPFVLPSADVSYYSALSENCTFTRLDTISMGCLLALAARSDSCRAWLDRLTRPVHLCLYFVAICVALRLGHSAKFHLCLSFTVNAACLSMLVWGLIRSEGIAKRILSNRIITTIGIGSYSIYLWQQLFIHPRMGGWVHNFPQNVALALGAAALSFWLIERPFNRLKDRVAC
jgi:peptidoglycan/LPS O-acetylase OafA/YrhL